MLATRVPEPFHRPGWVYEEKYDGFRIVAYKEGERVTLLSRNHKDRTASFAEITEAVRRLPARSLCLDGEVACFDAKLVSRFELMQQGTAPRVFAVFDCLWRDGLNLRAAPLATRRAALEAVVDGSDRLFPSRRLAADGLAAHRQAQKRGYEGLIAKDARAPYVEGRSNCWLKVKVREEEELVIGGYTAPEGTRWYFGALLLGAYRRDDLVFVGRVGTGFDHKTLKALHGRFAKLVVPESPFADLKRLKGATWLKPALVAQVAFHEWTSDAKLRAPVYLGLRDDKSPRECVLPARFARGTVTSARGTVTPPRGRRTGSRPAARRRRA
jgi:bifunctional non-homologous end joining protein LigD